MSYQDTLKALHDAIQKKRAAEHDECVRFTADRPLLIERAEKAEARVRELEADWHNACDVGRRLEVQLTEALCAGDMRASEARDTALEEAAKACDTIAASWREGTQCNAADACVVRIRALKTG